MSRIFWFPPHGRLAFWGRWALAHNGINSDFNRNQFARASISKCQQCPKPQGLTLSELNTQFGDCFNTCRVMLDLGLHLESISRQHSGEPGSILSVSLQSRGVWPGASRLQTAEPSGVPRRLHHLLLFRLLPQTQTRASHARSSVSCLRFAYFGNAKL